MVKVTILYDNTVMRDGLVPDWGFSALVEMPGRTLLFDAGADGQILMKNMNTLDIDPAAIDTVFMSHNHFDHTGGLADVLRANPAVRVYLPSSLSGVKRAARVIKVTDQVSLGEGVWSTGELSGIEQSLVVSTSSGLVVIVGCSHPGLEKILEVAGEHGHIHCVLGGFHGFDKFDALQDVDLVCPTHCTRNAARIASLFPKKYLPGGAGRIYTFPMD